MRKVLLSILLCFSFSQLSAGKIPHNFISSINNKIEQLVDKVQEEKSKDPSYITSKQLLEYKNDLITYGAAIKDSIHASPEEISTQLESITPWNYKILKNKEQTHILVVSWMSKWAYENFYKQYAKKDKEKYSIKDLSPRQSSNKFEYLSWVTIPYETKTFIRNFIKNNKENISLQKR